ncbi:MAG: GDP-mannose 4,6-dehydratase [Limnoraphis sp. WC205]|jgi:GDPmannose 4,6-dehydratase|nr:GDP-mannose 4,6-dehydratase [Limnoraphis sp. WC205]
MKSLILGANGQDGYYIKKLCEAKGIPCIGISRSGDWLHGDISDYKQVEDLVKTHEPTYIFHLAAKSTTRHDALFENHETISTGTINVLESVRRHSPDSKIFIAGSGVQFHNDGNPISEGNPFEPSSPYAVARIQSVYAARYYRSLGIKAYVGYLFHHESPLRKPNHVSQKVVLAAKRIAEGSEEKLQMGDVSVAKEWTFAGDVASGIITLVEQDNIFEAVIGSGKTYTIQDWIEVCFSNLGLDWRTHLEETENFKAEYKRLVSNPALIKSLGWEAKVRFSELAAMMIQNKQQL